MPSSPKHSPPSTAEDPDTAAARKELKQTAISDRPDLSASAMSDAASASASAPTSKSKHSTPDRDTTGDGAPVKDPQRSPKKGHQKRLHGELDDGKDAEADGTTDRDASPVASNGTTALSRTDRSEPEKKRPRDVSNESKPDSDTTTAPIGSVKPSEATDENEEPGSSKIDTTKPKDATSSNGGTSTSAFQGSSFASFAASAASPFASSAGNSKPLTSFASNSKPLTSFASLSSSKSPTLSDSSKPSIFGSTNSTSNGGFGSVAGAAPSPFATTGASNIFGSGPGTKPKAFGQPGQSFKSDKPKKAFGAPVSDDEDQNGEEDNEGSPENNKDVSEPEEAAAKRGGDSADGKKTKLQRVAVDDGESDEATLLQVRAKIFHLDKANNSWKERGAGNLRLNVPMPCVEIDEDTGAAIEGSFDASMLETVDGKVVRLIMRQDSTHRILLNTAIIPAMKFQEKSSLKATFVLFTALEDEGPVNIHLKMTSANAQTFIQEVEKVQRELRSV